MKKGKRDREEREKWKNESRKPKRDVLIREELDEGEDEVNIDLERE